MTTGFYEREFIRKVFCVVAIFLLSLGLDLNPNFFGFLMGFFFLAIFIGSYSIVSYDGYTLNIESVYLAGLIKRTIEIRVSDLREIKYDNFGYQWDIKLMNFFITGASVNTYNEYIEWFYKDGTSDKKWVVLNMKRLVPIMEEIKKDWAISVAMRE